MVDEVGKFARFPLWPTYPIYGQRPPDLRFDNRFVGLPTMRIRENMMLKIPVLFLSVLSLFWGVGAISQDKVNSREQVQFSAEDENMKQPVDIPKDAFSILKRDS
ncbi:MAG: hypothetical protein JWP98_1669, partial [Edaphobacter sp.]|nr:hypothetical protein [Edaphobacter sp.]